MKLFKVLMVPAVVAAVALVGCSGESSSSSSSSSSSGSAGPDCGTAPTNTTIAAATDLGALGATFNGKYCAPAATSTDFFYKITTPVAAGDTFKVAVNFATDEVDFADIDVGILDAQMMLDEFSGTGCSTGSGSGANGNDENCIVSADAASATMYIVLDSFSAAASTNLTITVTKCANATCI